MDGAPAGSASPPSDSEAWTEEPDRSEDPDRHPDSSGSVPYSPTGSAGLPEVQSSLRQRGARGLQSASRGISTVKASFRTSVRSLQTSMAKDVRTKRERKLRRQMTVLGGARPFLLSREWLWHVSLCAATSYLLYLSMFMSCFDRVVRRHQPPRARLTPHAPQMMSDSPPPPAAQVTGSVPALLKQNGFDFDEEYSIWSLSGIIYELGGFNRALMYTTYLVFCVIGPAVRCSTQLMLLLLPLPTKVLRMLHELSRNASIFYALEVLLVAVPLLNMTFGAPRRPTRSASCASCAPALAPSPETRRTRVRRPRVQEPAHSQEPARALRAARRALRRGDVPHALRQPREGLLRPLRARRPLPLLGLRRLADSQVLPARATPLRLPALPVLLPWRQEGWPAGRAGLRRGGGHVALITDKVREVSLSNVSLSTLDCRPGTPGPWDWRAQCFTIKGNPKNKRLLTASSPARALCPRASGSAPWAWALARGHVIV